MKNKINLFSIITLAAVFSFIAAGCDDTNTNNENNTLTITSVTVSPATATVAKGATRTFTAAVTGTNSPAQTVTWSIVETNKNAGTTISTSGVLTVAAAETLTSLTVRAASTVDNGKSGTATVTVTGGSNTLTGTISITGTAQVGQILTANTTSLGGSGTISYQWKRGDTSSAAGTSISSATSSTYTLVTADVGKYIKVTVTRNGYTGSIDSAATGAVLSATAPIPTVTNVTVSPATATVAKGATRTFTAAVTGTNSPAQTVTWSIVQTNKKAGTTIDTSGKLTVAADETLTTLTVKAVSTVDTSKSGTAAVAVTSTGGGAADFTGFTGATLTISSKDQETAKANGYDYELWSQDKRGPATMVLGNGGGGTFKCDWSNGYNVLARAGKKYTETQTHSEIGTISIEFNAEKFSVQGDVGYLSVYGWITGGTGNATTSANLVEYYIVENYNSYNPGTQGTSKGTVTIDGAQYTLYERAMTNAPSIKNGITTFTQYLSVRAPGSKRSSGTISVSEHFKAWNNAGMTKVNGKMYEVALKVEGWNGDNKSAASAEISKNILKINGVPIQ